MPLLCILFGLGLLTSYGFSAGVPIVVYPGLNSSNHSNSGVDCNDVSTGLSASCYKENNMTEYLLNWNVSFRPEICSPSQLWSSCYLNYAYADATPTRGFYMEKNDCSKLHGNSSTNGCPPPPIDYKVWTAREYYGAWTIYNVQHFIFVWSQAIAAGPSLAGILAALASAEIPTFGAAPTPPTLPTPSVFLQKVILRFGINVGADNALVRLLQAPATRPEPALASSGIGGGPNINTTAAQVVPLLITRLRDALQLVMKDFDRFLVMVQSGAFSGNALPLVAQLETALRDP